MLAHLYSGGAFFIKGLAQAVYTSCKHHGIPRVVAGNSSGALVAAVLAVKGVSFMYDSAMEVDLQKAHKHKAFNNKGKLSLWSILRFVFGFSPVDQNIRPILKKLISYADFLAYQDNDDRVKCFILTADIDDAVPTLWDISTLDYDAFLDVLEASCRMQGMCEPVLLPDHNGDLCAHWDGGQFDHIPTGIFTRCKPSEVVAFYTRDEFYNIPSKEMSQEGAFAKVMRMIEIDNQEKSKNDQFKIRELCKDRDITLYEVFIPRVLEHFYDNDKDRQFEQIEEGREAAFKTFNIKGQSWRSE